MHQLNAQIFPNWQKIFQAALQIHLLGYHLYCFIFIINLNALGAWKDADEKEEASPNTLNLTLLFLKFLEEKVLALRI